jgi:hypothetical protein
MPSPRLGRPVAAVALISVFVALSALVSRGQGPAGPREVVKASGPTRTFFTPDTCVQCHSSGVSPRAVQFGSGDGPPLVQMNEAVIWNERDKHRRAYDALTGPRGREIGGSLGFADVTRERACLSCHGTGFLPDDPPAEVSGAYESRSQGVGCTACHGPYLEWVQSHGIAGEPVRRWRRKSAAEKSRDFGMTDLRDPAVRAKLCASCHVGDADEGKVITHAMYAAGHPPLPGIEVSAFSEAMPPHWWEPDEVPLFRARPDLRARYHPGPSESTRTRAVVIGSVVVFRESMRLLASEVKPVGTHESPTTWPEYARFECYSCHHDLESPGYRRWRQVRGGITRFDGLSLKGSPGRPRLQTWPLALLPALTARTGTAPSPSARDAIRDGVFALHEAIDARPFGDAGDVSRAARRLETAAQTRLDAFTSIRFDGSGPPRLLTALASLDYDSARQIAWAIKSIHAGWRPRPPNDDQIVRLIGELDCLLKLDPYASRDSRAKLTVVPGHSPDQLSDALLRLSESEYKTSLERAAAYDPVAFKKLLASLSALLPETDPLPIPR